MGNPVHTRLPTNYPLVFPGYHSALIRTLCRIPPVKEPRKSLSSGPVCTIIHMYGYLSLYGRLTDRCYWTNSGAENSRERRLQSDDTGSTPTGRSKGCILRQLLGSGYLAFLPVCDYSCDNRGPITSPSLGQIQGRRVRQMVTPIGITDTIEDPGLDIETFETMWKLSEPGADTEGMFLRLPQTEYYRHKRSSPDALELMPGVCHPPPLHRETKLVP